MTIAAASSHARHIRRSPRACRRAVPSSRNAGKEVRCFDKLSTNGRKSGVKALTLRIIGQKGQPAIGLDAAIEAGAAPGVARGARGSDAQQQRVLIAIDAHFDHSQPVARRFALAPQSAPRTRPEMRLPGFARQVGRAPSELQSLMRLSYAVF